METKKEQLKKFYFMSNYRRQRINYLNNILPPDLPYANVAWVEVLKIKEDLKEYIIKDLINIIIGYTTQGGREEIKKLQYEESRDLQAINNALKLI
jgi:hypothetical protein